MVKNDFTTNLILEMIMIMDMKTIHHPKNDTLEKILYKGVYKALTKNKMTYMKIIHPQMNDTFGKIAFKGALKITQNEIGTKKDKKIISNFRNVRTNKNRMMVFMKPSKDHLLSRNSSHRTMVNLA